MHDEPSAVIEASFLEHVEGWYGREREMVSLFRFRHLLRHYQPGKCAARRCPFGLEVATPQLLAEVLHRLNCENIFARM